jgi:hypothetical protein
MTKVNKMLLSSALVLTVIAQLVELRSYFDTINLVLLIFFCREHFFKDNFGLILRYNILFLPLLFLNFYVYCSIVTSLNWGDLKCGGDLVNLISVNSVNPIPSLVQTNIYEMLYQLIINRTDASIISDTSVSRVSIAQNIDIDLMHRFLTDFVSSRRINFVSFVQNSVVLTNFVVVNHISPIVPIFANEQSLYAVAWGGFAPLFLGNTYLSTHHPIRWLGSADAQTLNQRISEGFIRIFQANPRAITLGLFFSGTYSMYYYPVLKTVLKY